MSNTKRIRELSKLIKRAIFEQKRDKSFIFNDWIIKAQEELKILKEVRKIT